MPFGILDCKKMEVVPGTGKDQASPPLTTPHPSPLFPNGGLGIVIRAQPATPTPHTTTHHHITTPFHITHHMPSQPSTRRNHAENLQRADHDAPPPQPS